jgi:ParB-like chromosome segregation protein Spo0J
MSNEILVDVGRDGTPLFVSGRHRLSLAKLLGLDTVPVAVRHPDCLRSDGPDGRSLAHP